MDPFGPVLGPRRGSSVIGAAARVPPSVLARLDFLCDELNNGGGQGRGCPGDDRVASLARGHGFDAAARGTDDYLLSERTDSWFIAVLAYEAERWRAFVSRELVHSVRDTGVRPASQAR